MARRISVRSMHVGGQEHALGPGSYAEINYGDSVFPVHDDDYRLVIYCAKCSRPNLVRSETDFLTGRTCRVINCLHVLWTHDGLAATVRTLERVGALKESGVLLKVLREHGLYAQPMPSRIDGTEWPL